MAESARPREGIGIGRWREQRIGRFASAYATCRERAQAPEPARGHSRLVVHTACAQQDDLRRIGHLRKVVRREPDALVRIGQAEPLAQRAVEEGVGGGRLGPGAFVQAREDHAIAALQACFERAEDRDTRMLRRIRRNLAGQ